MSATCTEREPKMTADRLPYFPLYAADFISHQTVATMTAEEVGAYTLLLCYQWRDNTGTLPDDDASLMMLARCPGGLSPKVRACFRAVDGKPGRIANERLFEEMDKARDKRAARKARAKAAADRRWKEAEHAEHATRARAHLHADAMPDAEHKHSISIAKHADTHNPIIPNTHKPINPYPPNPPRGGDADGDDAVNAAGPEPPPNETAARCANRIANQLLGALKAQGYSRYTSRPECEYIAAELFAAYGARAGDLARAAITKRKGRPASGCDRIPPLDAWRAAIDGNEPLPDGPSETQTETGAGRMAEEMF